jgi:hypothetical protein
MSTLKKTVDTMVLALDAQEESTQKLQKIGQSLVSKFNTTSAVRTYCRGEGYTRAQEAFIVDGFKYGRKLAGLSETV